MKTSPKEPPGACRRDVLALAVGAALLRFFPAWPRAKEDAIVFAWREPVVEMWSGGGFLVPDEIVIDLLVLFREEQSLVRQLGLSPWIDVRLAD